MPTGLERIAEIQRPQVFLSYQELCNATRFCETTVEELSAGNPHAGFRGGCGARKGTLLSQYTGDRRSDDRRSGSLGRCVKQPKF